MDTFRSVSHKVVLGIRFVKQYCPMMTDDVSKEQYNCSSYPPYPSGLLYAMSYSAMVRFDYLTQTVQYIYTDDVVVGIMATLGNVALDEFPIDKVSIEPNKFFQAHYAMEISNLIAFQGVDYASEQMKIWSEICYAETSKTDITRLNLLYCSSLLKNDIQVFV